jgi:hypothetical protein
MENTSQLKAILSEIVKDLIDLRANQVVIAGRVGIDLKTSLGAAQDAKKTTTAEVAKTYATLIAKIESL